MIIDIRYGKPTHVLITGSQFCHRPVQKSGVATIEIVQQQMIIRLENDALIANILVKYFSDSFANCRL